MLPILGKFLIFFGLSALGFQHAHGLKRRASCLRDVLGALERLERELGFALLPVETLLKQMKEGSRGAAREFFHQCQTRFQSRGEERLEEIWTETLQESTLPLTEEDKRLVQEVGGIMGRYDGDSQRQAFARIHDRLKMQQEEAAEEAARMGKVYSVLGPSIGLILALLLG